MRRIFTCFASLLIFAKLFAASPVVYAEVVGFSFSISGGNPVTMAYMTVYDESGTPVLQQSTAGDKVESPVGNALMKPFKIYGVTFSASGPYGSSYWLSFTPPEGYILQIDGVDSNLLYVQNPGNQYADWHQIELVPAGFYSGETFGAFSGIQFGGAISWGVGLGNLRNGRSAGYVMFREKDLSGSPLSRSLLNYAAPSNNGEINVVRTPNTDLRQIAVPQGFVDIVDDPAGGYWMNFYQLSQVTNSPPQNQLWSVGSGQTPWKTIRVELNAQGEFQITEKEY